ncbi:MAG: hypothetical protein CMO80_18200 [Verrucomicrobiales bacterium]|nr:hypothetical protein [Verrucomicrobiales bacterium]|tara:strand:- start:818 stop:2254 length:1437 start_codon:yes stop_codon:yes gene_type:complete
MIQYIPLRLLALAISLIGTPQFPVIAAEPVVIGSRPELFVDDYLIDRLEGGAKLRLHSPKPREIVMVFDKPWEGNTCAVWSVFRDGDIYRMYYRAEDYVSVGGKATHPAFLCYAESTDGIHWRRPNMGRVSFKGSKQNNIISYPGVVAFKDTNPNRSEDAIYKGFDIVSVKEPRHRELFAYQSADGIRWKQMTNRTVMPDNVTPRAFDTVNVAFWDVERGEYRAYVRDWRDGKRDTKTATSKDFLNWSEPQWINFPGATPENLYTSMVRPYPRNPKLFIGFPTRILIDRGDITEPLFMTSRDGLNFRLWEESIIRPGRNSDRWGNRCNYIWYGLIETDSDLPGKPMEYSIYSAEHYYMKGGVKLRRFTYRPDGFVSVNAPYRGGEVITKPLVFSGKHLILNYSTAAAGGLRVEIQGDSGKPIPGFALDECNEIYGDEINRVISWGKVSDLSGLANRAVRLRIQMKDGDLFSFRSATGQ